ncbi:LLM class flavin-dependent oxidoreductase [Hyphomonas sp.]|uniref:LLM class flavin-dependent oxidoreductase n=1 Tax=Hyphomonas sp. TaxID=87 RepID=UPI003526E690
MDRYPELGESQVVLWQIVKRQARLADELGYASLWLAEHHFQTLGSAPNPAVLLSAIAAQTSQIRLGPAVAVLPYREPELIAEDYALLDMISEGRLNMGVGSGSQPFESEKMGADFDERRRTFDSRLSAIRTYWGDAEKAGGQKGCLNVSPVQAGGPPVYVAGTSAESAYNIGKQGYGFLTLATPMTPSIDEVGERITMHRKGLSDGGHNADDREAIVVVFAHVGESAAAVKSVVVPALDRFARSMTGTALSDPEAVYQHAISSSLGLFGTREDVSAQLNNYRRIGATHLAFMSRFGGMDAEMSERSLIDLATV